MTLRPFHQQRPLACAAIAFGAGIWAGASFAWRPWLWAAGLAASLLLARLLPANGRKAAAGVMVCFLFGGALLGGWAAHPSLPPEGRYRVEGTLSADAALRADGTAAVYLENAVGKGEDEGALLFLGKLYWTYTPDPETPLLPREGERVAFTGKVYHPQGRVNPYGFDFRMFLLQKGVRAGVSGGADPIVLGRPGRGAASVLYGVRQWLGNRLRCVFGQDSALPEALLLGQRGNLPQETVQGFTDAGAAHLLAVSGLHVGLLAGVVLLPLGKLLKPAARLAVLSVFLLFYCALLDFSAPVVRASVLIALSLAQGAIRRAPDRLTTLCAAFFLILVFRPLDLFSASFQLSFCAVLGMILLSPVLEGAARWIRPAFLQRGLLATLGATGGTVLPVIQIFHRFSLIGLAVNPFLCALFGVLLPIYALALAAGCAYLPAGVWLAQWINPITRGLIRAVEWLGGLPFAWVRLPYLPWYCVAAAAAVLVLASRFVAKPVKMKAAAGALILAAAFGVWRGTECRDVRYVQLSVGQADTAIVMDGPQTLVLDTGDYGGDVASYLAATGRRADHLVFTHLHSDHCMGAEQLLEQRIPIGTVYLPEGAETQAVDERCLELLDRLRQMGIEIRHLHAGDRIDLGRASLQVVWPEEGAVRPGQDANRYCLVGLWDLDGVSLLTAADLVGEYEMYAAREADILKVSHHGSKKSTGAEFLAAVSPRAALISASRTSSSLPHPDTLARLEEAGVQVYDTGAWGALTLTVKNGEAELIPYLDGKEQP